MVQGRISQSLNGLRPTAVALFLAATSLMAVTSGCSEKPSDPVEGGDAVEQTDDAGMSESGEGEGAGGEGEGEGAEGEGEVTEWTTDDPIDATAESGEGGEGEGGEGEGS